MAYNLNMRGIAVRDSETGLSSSVSRVEETPEPTEYLYETTFAGTSIGTKDGEFIDLDGLGFYFYGATANENITSITAGGTSDRQLRAQFFSGAERTAGINTTEAIPGAGKRLHVAIDLMFEGYANFNSAIKKIFRVLSNGSDGDARVCTLNAQEGVWRVDGDDAGGGLIDQTSESAEDYGPNTFINQRRRLEFMLDITNLSSPSCAVWVDGVQVITGTLPARVGIDAGWNLDGMFIMTTFNTPAATASDYIDRIIFHNQYIGV